VSAAFLLLSAVLIVSYVQLPPDGRSDDFAVMSVLAVPAVVVGLLRVEPGERQPWWLLLGAVVAISTSNLIELSRAGLATDIGFALGAIGNALYLAAAIALVARQGRDDLGAIIDTAIVTLALGGLLWVTVLAPHLSGRYRSGLAEIDLFVAVFALCGILGALGRLLQVMAKPVPMTLWLLSFALLLALAGYLVSAVASAQGRPALAYLLFMGVYATVGVFVLDPTTPRLARAESMPHRDRLSTGRLVFLGLAVATIDVVVGAFVLRGRPILGLLLALGGPCVAALVMVRIGRLSLERDRAEKALRFEATHDSLTGLLNRREFVLGLEQHLPNPGGCAIIYCDLDGFKAVNDRLGHRAGDELLVEVAERLSACEPVNKVVSRFGGDEFVILVRNPTDADVENGRQCIAAAMSRPIVVDGEPISIGASIGVAVAGAETDPEELISRADKAMYEAKRAGWSAADNGRLRLRDLEHGR
jgi:diguanylate cyclase (GGDEF)-like protein